MQKTSIRNLKKLQEYLKQGQDVSPKKLKQSSINDALKSLGNLHSDSLRIKEVIPTQETEQQVDLRHKLLVEKVAEEVYNNLLFTQPDNEIVKEIKKELSHKYGSSIEFRYNAISNNIRVYDVSEQGLNELFAEKKDLILGELWHITLEKVKDTMKSISYDKENGMDVKKTSSSAGSFSQVGQAGTSRAYSASQVGSVSGSQQVQSGYATNGDTIHVSSEGMLRTEAFHAALSASDIRQEKIDSIKSRIASGNYHIDTKQLAFNLLRDDSVFFS